MTLCIKNARHLEAPVDLLVDGDRILTMTPAGHHAAPEGCEIFDAHGLALMPSFIDAHVHLREPGFEYKEDIASGLEAAAHGGFGAVMCMANTKPVNDTAGRDPFHAGARPREPSARAAPASHRGGQRGPQGRGNGPAGGTEAGRMRGRVQ